MKTFTGIFAGLLVVTLLIGAVFVNSAEASHGQFYWEGGYNWNGQWVSCLYSGYTHTVLFCF